MFRKVANRGSETITGHAGREPAKVDTGMTLSHLDSIQKTHKALAASSLARPAATVTTIMARAGRGLLRTSRIAPATSSPATRARQMNTPDTPPSPSWWKTVLGALFMLSLVPFSLFAALYALLWLLRFIGDVQEFFGVRWW
jgi:hypothetical protein